jgi:hypothetical protein
MFDPSSVVKEIVLAGFIGNCWQKHATVAPKKRSTKTGKTRKALMTGTILLFIQDSAF